MAYKLIAFDLDGTLAVSKSPLDPEMSSLLAKLIGKYKVAIISGGDFPQFQKQILNQLPASTTFQNLYLLPTSGGKMYSFDGQVWNKLYSQDIPESLRHEIVKIVYQTIHQVNFIPHETWGPQVEDRQTEITFSALGQQAPPEAKLAWDPDVSKRLKLVELLQPLLPEVQVSAGGASSVDIVQPGIDKGFGIKKIMEHTGLSNKEILFIGDKLTPNGNDYPVISTGVDTIQVESLERTREEIKFLLANPV